MNPLPSTFPHPTQVVRYHSLVLQSESLPSCLLPLAWTDDAHQHPSRPTGVLMAAAHASQVPPPHPPQASH
jgi:anthranilate/para-aminobenzoate synthase component II